MTKINKSKTQYSTAEAAKLLKMSRVAVFKKIKSGELKAVRIGRGYAINIEDLEPMINPEAAAEVQKAQIKKAVRKTIEEYGETLKLLGKE